MGNVIRGKKVLVPIRVKTKAQVGANDEVVRGCVCFHWYMIPSVMVCQLAPSHPSNDCASPIIHIPSSGSKCCTQAHRSLLTLTCSWPRHSEFPRKSQDSMIGSRKHASLSRTRSSSAKSHTIPRSFSLRNCCVYKPLSLHTRFRKVCTSDVSEADHSIKCCGVEQPSQPHPEVQKGGERRAGTAVYL